MTKTITTPATDNNVTQSTARRATKQEIDDAMLILTGTRSKTSSDVEISIPAMDTAFNVYCDGIRGLQATEGSIVANFALAFEASFGRKDWYELESKGKLGVGVREYHKKVIAFLSTLGNSEGYPNAQWLMIKKASGYMTDAMIQKDAVKKIEANKTTDEKCCGYITSILNLIKNANVDSKITPYKSQLESIFYGVGGKMSK